MNLPDLKSIREAYKRIAPFIHRTPVLTSSYLNRETGAEIFFKCENFQKVGAFKFRGACNAIMQLDRASGEKGIITHSSGNHAQAVALAAKMNGYKATIVMPHNAPKVKVNAVKGYGASVVFCKPTIEARQESADEIIHATGATFIHPYNHPHVIAGQGTSALELLDEVSGLDVLMAPVGGGGLISGSAIASKSLNPEISVIGGEPELADDAYRSLQSGKIEPVLRTDTVADGLRTSLGELTFKAIRNYVDQIITVPEESIIRDMRTVWERMKIIIEPSCAVPLSVIMDNKEMFKGKRIGLIITGGNVDLNHLPW
ncbi:MAG: pyridoxal-phosphate dependent enzyme [Balneolaceae bacterium]|nr:pyridoxal-phosphate dependent enzyme [Balneolaceae bacterium]MCH8549143.1 pyridoxal-phosphate dependent enzyme [Balneolaceae bacterium]